MNKAGRTAVEAWKGGKYRGSMYPFGARCLFRLPAKRGGCLDARWQAGIWLGKHRCSDEVLIWSDGAVHKAYALRGVPPSEQWDRNGVEGVSQHLWGAEAGEPQPAPSFASQGRGTGGRSLSKAARCTAI